MEKHRKTLYQVWIKTALLSDLKGEWEKKKEALVEYEKYKESDFAENKEEVLVTLDEVRVEGNENTRWSVVSDDIVYKKTFNVKK